MIVRAAGYLCVRMFRLILEVLCCGWAQVTDYTSWVSSAMVRVALRNTLELTRASTHI